MEKQLTAVPVNSIITDTEWQQANSFLYRNTVPYMRKENGYIGLLLAWRLAKNNTDTVESNRGTPDNTSRR